MLKGEAELLVPETGAPGGKDEKPTSNAPLKRNVDALTPIAMSVTVPLTPPNGAGNH